MILKKLRTRGGGIISAVVCALALAIPASVMIPATAAHAASACASFNQDGTIEVPYGCTAVEVAHACVMVISDGVDNADECADIWAQNTSGVERVWGEGEFYCQGKDSQCAGLNVTVVMSWRDSSLLGMEAATTAPARFKCNPNPGPACVTSGRNYVKTSLSSNMWGAEVPCVQTYSWDPYDGWDGTNQVFALKDGILSGAYHMGTELDSQNVHVCFETS